MYNKENNPILTFEMLETADILLKIILKCLLSID